MKSLNEQNNPNKKSTTRRQVSVGLGGFYLKTRNRNNKNTINNSEYIVSKVVNSQTKHIKNYFFLS
jgi:hypothetical protein